MQAPEITPGSYAMVPPTVAARCLQEVHTICMLPGVDGSAKHVFVPGDLELTFDPDIRTRLSEGPNVSSPEFGANLFSR